MAIVQRDFTRYSVYYITGNSPAVGLPQAAEIDCFTDTGHRAGIIYFYPDGVPLPPNQDTVTGIHLYYFLSRFSDLMTMIKEERPLYLYLDTVKKSGYVGTNNEPIGEQEGV